MLTQIRERRLPNADALERRIVQQIPHDIRARLDPGQISRLAAAVAPQRTRHGLALQASFRWITGRYYVALIGGRERRSDNRLRAEGQTIIPVGMSVFVFLLLLLIYGLIPLGFLVYVVKSALRINLMEGPSPVHTWICG